MAKKRIRTPSWFSLSLHRFLWSKRIAPIIAELGYGWLDGGCRTCAEALWAYITLSRTVEPSAVKPLVLGDRQVPAQHIVLHYRSTGHTSWFLDANGVASQEQLFWYWQHYEQLVSPFLREVDIPLLDEEGIVCHPRIKTLLTQELWNYFGPFRPAWLEVLAQEVRPGGGKEPMSQ